MTRTPRVTHAIREKSAAVREKTKACLDAGNQVLRRRSSGLTDPRITNRKMIYLGTTLALAGAGAASLTGVVGAATAAASPATSGHGTVASKLTSQDSPKATADQRAPKTVRPDGSQVRHAPHAKTWLAVERIAANHTVPRAGNGPLPAQDRLTPAGTSGPQSWLPMTPARYANATAIVHQALKKKMGLRSAVIAVATSMQESTLLNLNHGDRDSLGLFQQRPSTGWGSPSQILRPAFAADAFLDALHTHQSQDPAWAHQPLWQDAQDVQKSGVPFAYAKWEAQAAHVVSTITHRIY